VQWVPSSFEQALTVLGVEGFVAGIRDELVKDGIVHGNVVEIPGCSHSVMRSLMF
jgi:hypothetical protein